MSPTGINYDKADKSSSHYHFKCHLRQGGPSRPPLCFLTFEHTELLESSQTWPLSIWFISTQRLLTDECPAQKLKESQRSALWSRKQSQWGWKRVVSFQCPFHVLNRFITSSTTPYTSRQLRAYSMEKYQTMHTVIGKRIKYLTSWLPNRNQCLSFWGMFSFLGPFLLDHTLNIAFYPHYHLVLYYFLTMAHLIDGVLPHTLLSQLMIANGLG